MFYGKSSKFDRYFISHVQIISIWTGHLSSTQLPHMASGILLDSSVLDTTLKLAAQVILSCFHNYRFFLFFWRNAFYAYFTGAVYTP